MGAFGLSLLGYRRCGWGWLGSRRRKPRAGAWVAGSRLLQFAECAVGAFVDAMEARFVAGGERNGAGLVHQAAEGERQLIAGILGGFDIRQLAIHLAIDERGF